MKDSWPSSQGFWSRKRVMVTGGYGFLGKYVVAKLKERGAAVFIADQDCYDLRRLEDIRRALAVTVGCCKQLLHEWPANARTRGSTTAETAATAHYLSFVAQDPLGSATSHSIRAGESVRSYIF